MPVRSTLLSVERDLAEIHCQALTDVGPSGGRARHGRTGARPGAAMPRRPSTHAGSGSRPLRKGGKVTEGEVRSMGSLEWGGVRGAMRWQQAATSHRPTSDSARHTFVSSSCCPCTRSNPWKAVRLGRSIWQRAADTPHRAQPSAASCEAGGHHRHHQRCAGEKENGNGARARAHG